MAKKSRTPPPPRRPVQAPKVRSTAREKPVRDERRKRLLLFGGGGLGVIVVAVVLAVVFTTGGSGGSSSASGLEKTMAAAGCTLKTYPSQGRSHVQDLNAKIKYNSFPPTSGSHYLSPMPWNEYPTPVALVQEVHNLEHGGIIIQYGSKVPPATVSRLREFYQSDPNALVMAPLPQLGSKVALTAWTHLALCTKFDQKAFKAFRGAYRYKGPERFPASALQPGM